jgi:hypothetical protein
MALFVVLAMVFIEAAGDPGLAKVERVTIGLVEAFYVFSMNEDSLKSCGARPWMSPEHDGNILWSRAECVCRRRHLKEEL